MSSAEEEVKSSLSRMSPLRRVSGEAAAAETTKGVVSAYPKPDDPPIMTSFNEIR